VNTSAAEAGRGCRRALGPRRLVALITFSAVLLATATSALGADVRVVLPQVPIDVSDTSLIVSGNAPVSPPDQQLATLVVAPRRGTSCDPPAPPIAIPGPSLLTWPVFDPAVGQVLGGGVGGQPVSGTFSLRYDLVGVRGPGMVCAWLLTQDTPAGLVLGATGGAPIQLLYRLPLPSRGQFPFIQALPRRRGGTMTAWLGRSHSFKRFVATCADRGRHNDQRFKLTRRVTPNPATGAFAVTGIATPDNSRNYDAPIPAPYRGRALLTFSGHIVPTVTDIRIRGTFTLTGPGLTCARTTLNR
jgi:hypothetical protein